jgi:hypothetical protein
VPEVVVSEKKNKSRRLWPFGLLATGVAGTAVMLLRGCWHGKMSWPIRIQEHSYQVCLGCGIKRLFDEKTFRAYGPYSYDLNRLIGWEKNRTNDDKSKQTVVAMEVAAEESTSANVSPTESPAVEHRPAS